VRLARGPKRREGRPRLLNSVWIDWLDWKDDKHAFRLVNSGSRMGYGVWGRWSDGGGAERVRKMRHFSRGHDETFMGLLCAARFWPGCSVGCARWGGKSRSKRGIWQNDGFGLLTRSRGRCSHVLCKRLTPIQMPQNAPRPVPKMKDVQTSGCTNPSTS
jgi:hypothetical protein